MKINEISFVSFLKEWGNINLNKNLYISLKGAMSEVITEPESECGILTVCMASIQMH